VHNPIKVNKRRQGAVEEALHSPTAHRERDTDGLQGQDGLCDAVEDIDLKTASNIR
jgi:hypothetical protein